MGRKEILNASECRLRDRLCASVALGSVDSVAGLLVEAGPLPQEAKSKILKSSLAYCITGFDRPGLWKMLLGALGPLAQADASEVLMEAVLRRRVWAVESLVEAGVDPSWKGPAGLSAAGDAARLWHGIEVLRAMLRSGIDPDSRESGVFGRGRTLAFWVAEHGDLEGLMALAEAGADFRAVDGEGVSLLSVVAGEACKSFVAKEISRQDAMDLERELAAAALAPSTRLRM